MAANLWANEKVLWRGKPVKKALLLRSLGGIPFGLVFLAVFFMWATKVPFMIGLPIELALMLAGWGFGVIIVPPIWQLKSFRNTDYLITDKRLIILTWVLKQRVWWVTFNQIKEVGVKISPVDKLLGTGTVYPITSSYPFPPGMKFRYTKKNPYLVHKLPNPATGEYEKFSEMQIWQKTSFAPFLQALSDPYEVQKLLQKMMENAQTLKSQTEISGSNFNQILSSEQFPHVGSSQERLGVKQKIALVIGVSLLLLGLLVFAFGYFSNYAPYVSYENGYTYVDYVAVFGFAFGGTGALILFITFFQRFSKWAHEHGAIGVAPEILCIKSQKDFSKHQFSVA